MSIPGYSATASLYSTAGRYSSQPSWTIFAGHVLPMSTCCSDCPDCVDICSPGDCPVTNPGCCAPIIKACLAQRRQCLKTCVDCPPPPCCPKGCVGQCH